MNNQRNMILAVLLTGLLLFGWDAGVRYFYPNAYKPRPKPKPRPPEHEGLITIYQLRDYVDCKWPIGEWPDILYCGQPQEEGQVYCTKHCNLAYHPGRKQYA